MRPSSQPPRPWTLGTIKNWAQTEFGEEFNATEAEIISNDLQFENSPASTTVWRNSHRQGIPAGFHNKILKVGEITLNSEEHVHNVYAFIHGDNGNQVGYMYKHKDGTCKRLSKELDICAIDFEDVFSYLTETHVIETMNARVRATVCYIYLAKGLLTELSYYSRFPYELKNVCGWIACKGQMPHPKQRSGLASLQAGNRLQIKTSLQDDSPYNDSLQNGPGIYGIRSESIEHGMALDNDHVRERTEPDPIPALAEQPHIPNFKRERETYEDEEEHYRMSST